MISMNAKELSDLALSARSMNSEELIEVARGIMSDTAEMSAGDYDDLEGSLVRELEKLSVIMSLECGDDYGHTHVASLFYGTEALICAAARLLAVHEKDCGAA